MNKSEAISHLYPNASPMHDFRVCVELDGTQRIEYWGINGNPPTQQEMIDVWNAIQPL